MLIPIDNIQPNPEQPRLDIDQAELQELANSIRQHGLINPISVEQLADGSYQLIDGERRWRASKLAGLEEIKADVRPAMNGAGAQERLTLALVANLQREDMDPIEEALAYQKMKAFHTQAEIAELVSKSQVHVSWRLRLLTFEPAIQELFSQGRLPLDNQAIRALEALPDRLRVKAALGFANRGTSGRGIVASCKRLITYYMKVGEIEPVKLASGDRPGPKRSSEGYPAADLVRHKNPEAKWPAFIDQAARTTCLEWCPFSEAGDLTICRECPLPVALSKLST